MTKPAPADGIYLFSPAGAIPAGDPRVERGLANLRRRGYAPRLDRAALARSMRFAGTDRMRIAAFERAAAAAEPIAMITRGGYGLSRILADLPFDRLAASGKRWVGYSDFTAFQLAMLARAGAPTWSGPALLADFGGEFETLDQNTVDTFDDAMAGRLEVLGFRASGPAGIDERGVLWGGNLALVCAMLGTPWLPRVERGILFLEDVHEQPYRIERMLIQLLHAGVLDAQRVILLGEFNGYRSTDADGGFDMASVLRWLRGHTRTPVVAGLPFGHGRTRLCLPHGVEIGFATEGRTGWIVLPHPH
ncbi:MAG: LD-carboxypeptidase [Pseudomonadota bacterium]|nr:LD-carboxypeptidase [Pseudomonadota bacterium]